MSNERNAFEGDDLDQLQGELARMGPLTSFPWHEQQEWALRSATDVIQVNGGNQSGKSRSGMGMVGRLIRREGPIYDRLRNPAERELAVWIAPKTSEKWQTLWEPRIIDFVLKGMKEGRDYDYKQSPFPVFTGLRKDGTVDWRIHGKYQKQGFLAFESDAVDLIVLDEEPEDPRILSSCKQRFATTNGVMALCFTPLLGMSFTFHQNYAPAVKPKNKLADRVWRLGNEITVIEMGMADNPESVAGGGVSRLVNDPALSPAEKAARLFGKYGYTEGLLFPNWAELGLRDDDPYMLDALPPGRRYSWVLTADPNKRHGALLTAIDHEGNRFYCAEHYRESLPDSKHAEGYRQMLAAFGLDEWEVDIWADPGGAGSQAIINLAEAGIFAKPIPKDPGSVSASIKRLRGASYIDPSHKHPLTREYKAPRTYFLRWNDATGTGLRSVWNVNNVTYCESRLIYELRQYRQEEDRPPDTPVKAVDDCVDCARYCELARSITPEQPIDDPVAQARAALDQTSRQAATDFDAMAARSERAYLDRQQSARSAWDRERGDITRRAS